MSAVIDWPDDKPDRKALNKPMAEHPYNYVRKPGAPPLRPPPPRYKFTPATTRLREFLVGDKRNVRAEMPRIGSDYGERVFDAAWEGDPLMDDVVQMFNRLPRGEGRRLFLQAIDHGIGSLDDPPAELVALFAQLDHIPDWLDWDLLDAGALALDKSSLLGFMLGVVLGALATAGSHSVSIPVGMTGRFQKNVVNRTMESLTFYSQTGCRDGLRRHGPGFKAAANVRLMHAMVRAKMVKSKEGELFNYARNGNPMNQFDTAFGVPLFGLVIGLCEQVFGNPVSERDLEGLRMQWSYIGYLLGVRDDIVPRNAEENYYLLDVSWATLGDPSQFTYALYEALFLGFEETFTRNSNKVLWKKLFGKTLFDVLHAYSRYMLGNELCDDMRAVRPVRHLRWLPRVHAEANKIVRRFRARTPPRYRGRFTPEGGELIDLMRALLQPSEEEGKVTFAHHDNLTRPAGA